MKCLLLSAAIFVSVGTAGYAVERDLSQLELIRAGYSQWLASIESVRAVYDFRGVNLASGKETKRGEVVEWMSKGPHFRYQRNPDHLPKPSSGSFRNPLDVAVKDDVSTTLRWGPDGADAGGAQATISHPASEPVAYSDFRSRCLRNVVDFPLVTVLDALSDAERVRNCSQTETGDFLVEYEVGPGELATIWFSAEKNFLVTRMETAYEENPRFAGHIQEVVESVEAKPGIWFPKVVDFKQLRRTEAGETIEPAAINRMVVQELEINEPLPADAFTVSFPAGTEVTNELTGTLYFCGEDGQPGEEMPIPQLSTPPPILSNSIEDSARATRLPWFIAINVGLIVVLALVISLRRKPTP